MSYREVHPVAPLWTEEQANSYRKPEPYDRAAAGALFEIDAPDGSTTFLMSITGDDFRESDRPEYFTYYGTEAPRTCEMRRAFEWGEISWRDFWMHKGWLLRMRTPYNGGPMYSTYVSNGDPSKHFLAKIDEFGFKSPYHFKLQQLELNCNPALCEPSKIFQAEHEYQQFMMRHGHKFAKRAA